MYDAPSTFLNVQNLSFLFSLIAQKLKLMKSFFKKQMFGNASLGSLITVSQVPHILRLCVWWLHFKLLVTLLTELVQNSLMMVQCYFNIDLLSKRYNEKVVEKHISKK